MRCLVTTLHACLSSLSLLLVACSNSPTEETATTANAAPTSVEALGTPAIEAAAEAAPEDPPIPADTEIVTTESGLKYSVLTKGEGTRTANVGDEVSIHYTGWLPDGTVFDSSRGTGRPYKFNVGSGVIAGWSEAAQHMGLGDRLKVTIPPQLAYGKRGSPPVIPAEATLIFEMEMVDALFMPEFREGVAANQKKTESGLVYEVVTEGTGEMPAADDVVDLRFAVWSEDGTMLACSEQARQNVKGQCGELPLEIFNEGPPLMNVGARYRFIVPANLAFGEQGQSMGLAPDAVTIWELELVGTMKPLPVPAFAMPTAAELTTTASGLAYRVEEPGSGEKVQIGQSVTVHYAGWLEDGELFDASYKRGETIEFAIQPGGLIEGWIEGIQLMSPGAVYTFVIPANLGYGDRGSPPRIPGGATLVFRISLVSVE